MQIFPNVKERSKDKIKLSLPIGIDTNKDLIIEINTLFKMDIFKFQKDNLVFKDSSEEGYWINLKDKVIEYKTYKDKVNSLFTIAQYIFEYGFVPIFIKDKQSFKWLGLNIDIARTFFNKEELKRLILIYSSLKYNKIHIHLTDDQGWRVEIKKYPSLTEDGKFLSQKDIKELVSYASLFGMDIIPEFGVPGHTRALMAKIDGLSCNGKKVLKWNEFGVSDAVLCLSNPKNKEVILNIYKEICSLFPYSKIHIGGDECPTKSWKNCKSCKKECKEKELTVYELQNQYIKSIIKSIKIDFNKEVIMWDDIQEYEKLEGNTISFWRSWCLNKDNDYLNKIAVNNALIISPVNFLYLDWTNNPKDNAKIKMDKNWTTSLEKVFSFNPLENVDKSFHHKVLGSEASLWTEKIKDFDRLIYQAFPRSLAVIEVLWGNKGNFEDFLVKLRDNKYINLIAPKRYKETIK